MSTASNVQPLSALRGNVLPSYLVAELAATPTIETVSTFGTHTRVEIQPDIAVLFPFDEDEDYASPYSPASAWLLHAGTAVCFDTLSDTCGPDVLDNNLQIVDSDAFDVDGLSYYLPDAVVDWLAAHTADEAAAWFAMLLAEIQMHAAQLALGRFPQPHSPGSEMALHLIFGQAEGFIEAVYVCGDRLLEEFEGLSGSEDHAIQLNRLRDSLFEDFDILMLFGAETEEYVMSCREMHPQHWFEPFCDDRNPWVAPVS